MRRFRVDIDSPAPARRARRLALDAPDAPRGGIGEVDLRRLQARRYELERVQPFARRLGDLLRLVRVRVKAGMHDQSGDLGLEGLLAALHERGEGRWIFV